MGQPAPAFMPFSYVVCRDMAFLQKVTNRNRGGACKVMKHFCIYCEVHGDEDMFRIVVGDNMCVICKSNGRESCSHRAVNDRTELADKASKLLCLRVESEQHLRNTSTNPHRSTLLEQPPHNCRSPPRPLVSSQLTATSLLLLPSFTCPATPHSSRCSYCC